MSAGEAATLALDFDLSCMWFGRWVDRREKATKKASRPRNASKYIDVPRYESRAEMLGIVEGLEEQGATPEERAAQRQAEAEMKALEEQFRTDPEALMDWLGEQ